MARKVFDQEFFADVIFNVKEAMKHAFDAALMQAGEKVADYTVAFDKYVEFFATNTVTPDPKPILKEESPAEVNFAFAAEFLQAGEIFVNDFLAAYNKDKESCAPFLNTEDEKKTRWRSVTSQHVFSIDRPGLKAHRTAFRYGEVRGRYLRLRIYKGDDEPLKVQSCTARMIDKILILEQADLQKTKNPVFLYAGARRLAAPQYDLAQTMGNIKQTEFPGLSVGVEDDNPHFGFVPVLPWSERNKPLLWTATITGVVVFGLLTFLLLKKAAQHQEQ